MKSYCESSYSHTRCGSQILRCRDCNSVGCSNPRCSNQAFKNGTCLQCGSRSKESTMDYERRIRKEQEELKKNKEREKRELRESQRQSKKDIASAATAGFVAGRVFGNRSRNDEKLESFEHLQSTRKRYEDETNLYQFEEANEEPPIVIKKETEFERIAREKKDEEYYRERERQKEKEEEKEKELYCSLFKQDYDWEGIRKTREWEKKVEAKFKKLIDKEGYKLKDFLRLKGTNVEGVVLKEYKIREFYYKIKPSWLMKLINFFEN